jgi:protein TonB
MLKEHFQNEWWIKHPDMGSSSREYSRKHGIAALSASMAGHGILLGLAVTLGLGIVASPQVPIMIVETVNLSGASGGGGRSEAAGQAQAMDDASSPALETPSSPMMIAQRKRLETDKPKKQQPPRTQAQSTTSKQEEPDSPVKETGPSVMNGGKGTSDVSGSGHGVGNGQGSFEGEFGSGNGPRFAKRVTPSYPQHAKRLGKEGVVLLRLTIDSTGKLQAVEVVQSAGQLFDEEAVQALKASTFLPASANGHPVPSLALIRIRFSLSS